MSYVTNLALWLQYFNKLTYYHGQLSSCSSFRRLHMERPSTSHLHRHSPFLESVSRHSGSPAHASTLSLHLYISLHHLWT